MSNPLVSENFFKKNSAKIKEDSASLGYAKNDVMTYDGTLNKTAILLLLTIIGAAVVWNFATIVVPYYLPIIIVALVLALIISFSKTTAPYLAPIYAILEGIAIGSISALFETAYPGIIIQAVGLTFGVFLIMLFLYKSEIIKPTEKFKKGIIAATGAILIVYLIDIFGRLTGLFSMPFIHETGPFGIIISLIIVGIAAFNLILDFDNIKIGVENELPKYMEWYVSFGLLVTLIWLYLEILELLAKTRSNR